MIGQPMPALRHLMCVAGCSLLCAGIACGNALRLGEPAPSATLVTLDGQRISTADLAGKVVILTFWATWCGPCKQELPMLSAYAKQHAAQGLTVLAFSLDGPEELPKVRGVQQSLSFPVGLIANATLPGYGRIWRIPVNFLIDRQGRLIEDGWKIKDKDAAWTPERLERLVTPLLDRQGAPGVPFSGHPAGPT